MNKWLQNEAMDYAKIHQPDIAIHIEQLTQEHMNSQLSLIAKPIREILISMNSPEDYMMQHMNTFMSYNIIGSEDNYIGSKFVSSWYDRNLKIFSNIQRICEEDDRMLVIIGAGHLATLISFINNTENLDFVSPNIYLKQNIGFNWNL